jgi:arylsulfatase A-like enzyme
MFTGLYPIRHGVVSNGLRLRSGLPSLASLLHERGWRTAAFTGVDFLEQLSHGFQHFDAPSRHREARAVVDAALGWLGAEKSRERSFVWIHVYDPHHSGRRPVGREAYLERIRAAEPAWPELAAVLEQQHGVSLAIDDQLKRRIDHYDALVASVDAELQRLYDFQARRAPTARRLWVVTADHGEGLGSHGYLLHSRFVYDEQLHVPLVFHASDGRWGSRVVEAQVRLVDLAPTILGLVIPGAAPAGLDGRSLAAWFGAGEGPTLPPAFAQRTFASPRMLSKGWEPGVIVSIQDGCHKYIMKTQGDDEFYDVCSDPLEHRNLLGAGDPAEVRMRDLLLDERRRQLTTDRAVADPGSQRYQRTLRALGYLGGGDGDGDASEGPDTR